MKWDPVSAVSNYQYSVAKVADALDFFQPEVVAHIRTMGEEPRFHTKQWEYAQVLEAKRRYAPNAKHLAGVGCGREPLIPILARQAEKLTATDLYDMTGAWADAQERPDRIWPELKNLVVHPMDMRKVDLPHSSVDFIWSLCAVEHVGQAADVVDTVRQIGKLLAPGGIFVLTTEYTFDDAPFYVAGKPSGTLQLSKSVLRSFYMETGLHCVEPIDLRVSTHPFNVPVWNKLTDRMGMVNLPHVLYRVQPMPVRGTYGTCVSVVLSKEDHGNDRIIEDPDQPAKLKAMFELGRKMSRKLTLPTRWW
jgi:SAM-dependent methyltransferase